MMSQYMDNPTCPATDLKITPEDSFKSPPAKRNLVLAARALKRRDGACTHDSFNRFVSFAAMMFVMGSPRMDQMGDLWNQYFAENYDILLEYEPLLEYFQFTPGIDISSYIRNLLLNPLGGAIDRREEDGVRETFCESPSSNSRRDVNPLLPGEDIDLLSHVGGDAQDIEKRWISPSQNKAGHPTLASILAAINSDRLTVHYARWQWYSGGGRPGPMLEIAYRIPLGAAGNAFRDTSHPAGTAPDEWIGKFRSPCFCKPGVPYPLFWSTKTSRRAKLRAFR
ncbi:hypothetical protein IMZ48_21290 [Candidatus Bathyarchaeota archaeon]|nr:hypothetical protein [Candidatus Bathyarchaeota archaeon]